MTGKSKCKVSNPSKLKYHTQGTTGDFIWGGISLDTWYEIYFYITAGAEPLNVISKRISDDAPKQMKILNTVIPIQKRLYSLVSYWSGASLIKPPKGLFD